MGSVSNIKVIYKGGFMSGDAGLHHNEQEVIFYDEEMTETKIVLLSLKGTKFMDRMENMNGRRTDI